MAQLPLRTFAGGELSEAVASRSDVAKRHTGVRTMLNFFAARSGAAVNRAGTKFVNEVKDSTQVAGEDIETGVPEVLIPFIFNSEQAFVLEFGAKYIRIHRNGAPLLVGPLVPWSSLVAYVHGDLVSHAGVNYMAIVDSTNKAPDLSPTYWYAQPAVPSWYSGAATALLEIPTPYAAGEITKQNVAQSGDILTIAHVNHAPHELKRFSTIKWTLSAINYQPTITPPTTLSISTNNFGPVTHRYKVTAIAKESYEESMMGYKAASVTNTILSGGDDDITITSVGHGLATGEYVFVSAVTATVDVNTVMIAALQGKVFRVTINGTDEFSLDDTSGIPYSFEHTLTWHVTQVAIGSGQVLSKTRHVTVQWASVPEALEYWIYKESPDASGAFGYVGNAVKPLYRDEGAEPDMESPPPLHISRFERDGRHPNTVGYFQQRLCYAHTELEPQAVWMSRTGAFTNFSYRSPSLDDDPIIFSVVGTRVNEVRHIVGMNELLVLTLGNEQAVRGDQDGVIRPDAINMRVQGYNGASNLRPIEIGDDTLYVQARGSIVRSLAFDSARDAFGGGDLTLFASHLVDGRELLDWAYTRVPHSIVWCPRDDGSIIALTYILSEEIVGWHRHATYTSSGAVQSVITSVASIPEDGVDVLYWIAERVINGATVRYVEKMMRRCTAWEGA